MITEVYKLEIQGKPRVQKNSRQILHLRDGRAILAEDSKVKTWRKQAVRQLEGQWLGKPTITEPLAVILVCHIGKRQRSDTDNLAAGPLDALEKAGVVKNDSQFSEVVVIRRKDWDNPRVEIFLLDPSRLHVEIMADDLDGYSLLSSLAGGSCKRTT